MNSSKPNSTRLLLQRLLIAGLVAAYIFISYAPSLRHALLGFDEMYQLSFIQGRDPLIGLVQVMPAFNMVYRPLFSLQAWALLQVFGLHYTGYQATELLLLTLAALTLYAAARRLLVPRPVALLLALAFSTHPYISDLTNWPVDTAIWTTILGAIGAVLLLIPAGAAGWLVALGLVVVIAPFTRENGLAIVGAMLLATLYARRVGRLTNRQTVAAVVLCLLAILVYFGLRRLAGGTQLRPSQLIEESGLWDRLLVRADVIALTRWQRVGYFAYNVLAQAWSSFVPIFMPCGVLWPRLVGMLVAVTSLAAAGVGLLLTGRRRWLLTALLAAVCLAALVAVAGLLANIPLDSGLLALGLAIHGAITVLALPLILKRRRWAATVVVVAIYALLVLGANSAIAFPYFRYRSLYLGLIGFILLMAAIFSLRPEGRRDSAWQQVGWALLAALVVVNGVRVNVALPVASLLPENFSSTSWICYPEISGTLAMDIAAEAHLDAAAVANCRADFANRPIQAPVAPEQGEALLAARHCGRSY